jgi:hypothetical protein
MVITLIPAADSVPAMLSNSSGDRVKRLRSVIITPSTLAQWTLERSMRSVNYICRRTTITFAGSASG